MSDQRLIHVVDDDDSVRRSAGFLLRTSGYAVRLHTSGVAFLREIKAAEPGCVLLDVRMPEIDGLAVQEELVARGITMPVIILTGHADVSIAVQAMKTGAVDFIENPSKRPCYCRRSTAPSRGSRMPMQPHDRARRRSCGSRASPRANKRCWTGWHRGCPTRRSPMIWAFRRARSKFTAPT